MSIIQQKGNQNNYIASGHNIVGIPDFIITRKMKKIRRVKSFYLLTIISSPIPVAKHNDPATLVAIFSRGRVTMGKPAQRISVPVVWALHSGLNRMTRKQKVT